MDAGQSLDAGIGFEFGLQIGLLPNQSGQNNGVFFAGRNAPGLNRKGKFHHALAGRPQGGRERMTLFHRDQKLPEAHSQPVGFQNPFVHGGFADPTGRIIDNPAQGLFVSGVHHQTEIR